MKLHFLTCWSHSGQDLVAILTFFVLFVDIVRFLGRHTDSSTVVNVNASVRESWTEAYWSENKEHTKATPLRRLHITVYEKLNPWACAHWPVLLTCCFQVRGKKWEWQSGTNREILYLWIHRGCEYFFTLFTGNTTQLFGAALLFIFLFFKI